MPDGGPRVLVGPQPGVGADGEREHRDAPPARSASHASWSWPSAEHRVAERLGDEVLRQPLHQQQAEPAQHPDGRQQHLVGPPAGEDEREVDGEQRAEVDERGPAGRAARSPGRRRAAPARRACGAAGSRPATPRRRPARRRRGRAAPARSARARADAGSRGSGPAPGRRRSRAAPVEAEADLADLDLVAEPERPEALDRARR